MANDNFDLPRPTDDVPSATSAVINDDAKVLDYVINGTGTVTTRTGKQVMTIDQAIQGAAPVPLNGGVWASGQTFEFYNQYMYYDGLAYAPLPATTLPYTVGATPDLGFVYQIKLNSLQLLSGLTDPSDLDKSYRRATTVAEIESGVFTTIPSYYTVTDRMNAPFDLDVGAGADGYGVLDAGNGNIATLSTSRPVTHVEYFGAVADGLEAVKTDNTAAIQAASDSGGEILCLGSGYYIPGSISIPSNTTYKGSGNTEFLGVMTPEGGGGYPNQMFVNSDVINGNENISFDGIRFNFAKGAFDYAVGEGLTTINSLKFIKVDGLSFAGCEFFDFTTNLQTGLVGVEKMRFGMAQITECSNISIDGIKTENMREEGFNFYQSTDIEISNWSADGLATTTSSHAAFWYCDGVNVHDTRIKHNGGSCINCFSRNAHFTRVYVNDELVQQGKGINFSDQIVAESFDISNISVTHSSLNVAQFGIEMPNGTTLTKPVSGIDFSHNAIKVKESSGVSFGIRLSDPRGASVKSNEIIMGDSAVSSQGNCILMQLQQTTETDWAKGASIEDNVARGNTFLSLTVGVQTSLSGLSLIKNNFEAQSIGDLQSDAGASTFVFLKHNVSSGLFLIDDINIKDNTCTNIEGSPFTTNFIDGANISFGTLAIDGNEFSAGANVMDRGLTVSLTGAIGKRRVDMNGNKLYDSRGMTFVALQDFCGDRNTFEWANPQSAVNRIDVYNHQGGNFELTNTRMRNANATVSDIRQAAAGTYEVVNISGNASVRSGGAIAWGSTMPANTALPN